MQFNGVYCIISYINTHATLHFNNMFMKKKYNLIKILVLYVGFMFNSLLLSQLLWQCILMQSILVEISRLDYLCSHLFFFFWFVINSRPISYLIQLFWQLSSTFLIFAHNHENIPKLIICQLQRLNAVILCIYSALQVSFLCNKRTGIECVTSRIKWYLLLQSYITCTHISLMKNNRIK